MVAKLIGRLKKGDWHYEKRRMLLREETGKFARAFKENFTTLMITAFGLTAGLLWQDAIRTFINNVFPLQDPNNFIMKIYGAVIVTIIAVIATYFLSKFKSQNSSS